MVVDEVVLTIRDIYFDKGLIWLVCEAESPSDHKEGVTDMRFYGRDGAELGTVRVQVPGWKGVTGTLTVMQSIHLAELNM
jgi:hypothetical protein